jgi:hypothetical protein
VMLAVNVGGEGDVFRFGYEEGTYQFRGKGLLQQS